MGADVSAWKPSLPIRAIRRRAQEGPVRASRLQTRRPGHRLLRAPLRIRPRRSPVDRPPSSTLPVRLRQAARLPRNGRTSRRRTVRHSSRAVPHRYCQFARRKARRQRVDRGRLRHRSKRSAVAVATLHAAGSAGHARHHPRSRRQRGLAGRDARGARQAVRQQRCRNG